MAKKRPKVSTIGGISKEEAQSIGKRVTTPTPEPIKKPKAKSKKVTSVTKPIIKSEPVPIVKPVATIEDPMVIVRIRKTYKQQAKAKASTLDLNLYEYLEQLIERDLND